MIVLINLTGLNKIYWLPKIRRESDTECGIWYFDVRFLFCQISVFNKTLGKKLIVAMNDKHTWLPE
jgi:hypothetical protein